MSTESQWKTTSWTFAVLVVLFILVVAKHLFEALAR